MPDGDSKPRTQLPKGTPKELRDFVRCRTNKVDIKAGELDWLPNMPAVDLTFEKGPKGSLKLRITALGGVVDIGISVTVVKGQLVPDTSDAGVLGDNIKKWFDDLNADLKAKGNQFGAASIKNGKLHITKTKIPAGDQTAVTTPQPPMSRPPPPRHVTDPIPDPVSHQTPAGVDPPVPPRPPPPRHVTDPIPRPEEAYTPRPPPDGIFDQVPDQQADSGLGPDAPVAVRRFYDDWAAPANWSGKSKAIAGGTLLLGAAAVFIFMNQDGTPLTPATTVAPSGAGVSGDTLPPTTTTSSPEEVGAVIPSAAGVDFVAINHLSDLAEGQGLNLTDLSFARSDPVGDFDACGPSTASGADIVGLAAGQDGDTMTAVVLMGDMPTSSAEGFSFAVNNLAITVSGIPTEMTYEVHNDVHLVGEVDSSRNLVSGSEAEVTINDSAVVFSFPVDPSDPIALLFAQGFNTPTSSDPIGCDSVLAAAFPFPIPASEHAGDCTDDQTTACLNNGRFGVQVTGLDDSALDLLAFEDDTAIFGDDESRGIVRVLNGCPVNESFWVFTDGFESGDTSAWSAVTVRDTVTSESKVFNKPLEPAEAIQDTQAFATCP